MITKRFQRIIRLYCILKLRNFRRIHSEKEKDEERHMSDQLTVQQETYAHT
jgi:hypothetical protein